MLPSNGSEVPEKAVATDLRSLRPNRAGGDGLDADPWGGGLRRAPHGVDRASAGARHFVADDGVAFLLRHKRTIIFVAILTSLVAFGFSHLQKPVYRATGDLLLQSRRSEQILDSEATPRVSDRSRIQTELQILKSRSIRNRVAEQLGKVPQVSVAIVGETDVLQIAAESTSAEDAARVVNTYADTFISTRRQQLIDDLLAGGEEVQKKAAAIEAQLKALDGPMNDLEAQIAAVEGRLTGTDSAAVRQATADRSRLGQELAVQRRQAQTLQDQKNQYDQQLDQLQLASNLTQTGGAQLISRAVAPDDPFRPKPVRNAILGLLLGLVLGIGLAFVRDRADNTVQNEMNLEDATDGLAMLAAIPTVAGWRRRSTTQVVSLTEPTSRASESYRALRTSLEFLGREYTCRLVQVTSPVPGEGKTATVANLGVALALTGRRVIIVSCDLRRPRLHEYFGLENDVGLTSVVLGQVSLSEALVRLDQPARLAVLPSGPPPPNPSELLASRRTAQVLKSLADVADIVIIDSAPVLPVTDGVVLARMVDATILVARARKTTIAQIRRTVERLRQVDAPLAGTVLNQFDTTDGEYYYGPTVPGTARWFKRGNQEPQRLGRRTRNGSSSARSNGETPGSGADADDDADYRPPQPAADGELDGSEAERPTLRP